MIYLEGRNRLLRKDMPLHVFNLRNLSKVLHDDLRFETGTSGIGWDYYAPVNEMQRRGVPGIPGKVLRSASARIAQSGARLRRRGNFLDRLAVAMDGAWIAHCIGAGIL